MTTRHAGYVVALEQATREDDAAATIAALRQIKGVVSVEPVEDDAGVQIAHARARTEIAAGLWKVLMDREGTR